MKKLKQHQRALRDLSFKQKITVISWILWNWKGLNKYHKCVITEWYGDKAFTIAKANSYYYLQNPNKK